jgi:hypothetical protein
VLLLIDYENSNADGQEVNKIHVEEKQNIFFYLILTSIKICLFKTFKGLQNIGL